MLKEQLLEAGLDPRRSLHLTREFGAACRQRAGMALLHEGGNQPRAVAERLARQRQGEGAVEVEVIAIPGAGIGIRYRRAAVALRLEGQM